MAEIILPFTSFCIVESVNEKGTGALRRLADLDGGNFQTQFNPSAPPFSTLYSDNCTLPVDFLGIFVWGRVPRQNGDSKRTKVELCPDKIPIEIIILQSCISQADLREKLLRGIDFDFATNKFLLVYPAEDSNYRGVLGTASDFESVGNRKKLRATRLNFYEISEKDFLRVEEKIFYSKLHLDVPAENFYLQSLSEFIKGKIIARVNWSNSKNKISQNNLQIFCEFLRGFSDWDFYAEIAGELEISLGDAQKAVDEFVAENIDYLQAEIFDDIFFENLIYDCPTLRENFKQIISKKWHAENEQKISAAKSELEKVQIKIDAELEELLELEDELKLKQVELEKVSSEISAREKLAVEVESKVARRIESAKKNVADFICEMAFVNPNVGVQTPKNTFYRAGNFIAGDESEIIDYEDFVYVLETEIGVEGTNNENLQAFAEYLTAAYANKILLLLAGSNARDIADAFSVTLTGKTAAIFDCAKVNSFDDLETVSYSDDEIICVLNPFAPNFIAYLPELVSLKGKYFFAIYPFAEDLKLEPRSFYNYFLPVFTELVIDRPPARDFPNKYVLSAELRQDFSSKYNPDKISISAEKRIKELSRAVKKSTVLFAEFPLAYVKGNGEQFLDDLTDATAARKIRAFLGVEK